MMQVKVYFPLAKAQLCIRDKISYISIIVPSRSLFAVPSSTALSELWYRNHPHRWLSFWSNDASDWRFPTEMEWLACLGSVFREMEASLAPSMPAFCGR
ncbi:hypothetical protein YC2023_028916 [Brassica napus]